MFGYIGNRESDNKEVQVKRNKVKTVWASFINVELTSLCNFIYTSSILIRVLGPMTELSSK